MWIRVTQSDINKGIQGDPWFCPIARAAKRATRSIDNVGGFDVEFKNGSQVAIPDTIIEWISDFDSFGPLAVKPIAFQIKRPV